MKHPYNHKLLTGITFLLFTALLLFACQKEFSETIITSPVPDITPDLVTKVTSRTVTGFVTDEMDKVVGGASVRIGTNFTTTDKYGYFEVRNVEVIKNTGLVTVTKMGYFKGIKTYLAEEGKAAFFRIKLIPKTSAGSFEAATGGTVNTATGLKLSFAENSIVSAANGNTYGGTVFVAAHWFDPTSADINNTMPGDLRGVDTANHLRKLTTFGMAAVELTSVTGELLQVAPTKKVSMSIPLPAAIAVMAPASIPLWYFDENTGLWKQEGKATKTGNEYTGSVSHFSFWNCDLPGDYISFNCTIKDVTGNPIPFAEVKLLVVGNPQNYAFGYTDSSGYVNGAVPANSNLKLEVRVNSFCNTIFHSQNFTTTNVPLSIGTINVSIPALNYATISGTVTNCNDGPVTNGFLIAVVNNRSYHYNLSGAGEYSFQYLLCNGSESVQFIAEDRDYLQQNATTVQATINSGNNIIPNIKACGTPVEQFIRYSSNGIEKLITYPTDTFAINSYDTTFLIQGASKTNMDEKNIVFSFDKINIGVNSTQPAQLVLCDLLPLNSYTVAQPIALTITEYGGIGQYVSGHYTAYLNEHDPALPPGQGPIGTAFTLTCSFRFRIP